MKDYKIRVENEAESKEAQELFAILGYSRPNWTSENYDTKLVCTNEDGDILCSDSDDGEKELTLPQLKDLAVLKRNDRSDKTHTRDWFVSLCGKAYVYDTSQWRLMGNSTDIELQPIEKEMSIFDTGRHIVKEYLDTDNGYALITADEEIKGDSNWIEVPDGADIYIELTRGIHGFYKDNFKFTHHGDDWHKTEAGSDYCWINHPVLWQRNKQPEELLNISESPESSIKKLKVEWFEKFLDGVKVQYRIGVAVGKKDAQWHNFTSNALKDMTHNLIEFREAPKHVTLDGIAFKTQESLLKYIVNNYNFD